MRFRNVANTITAVVLLSMAAATLSAQASVDPSARLRVVLPDAVAQHVLATIATARAQSLPAQALENRALKFAAKGVAPADIARSVDEQFQRMRTTKTLLAQARGHTPAGDEIAAGAEALREGVDGRTISQLAQSAPSGRSLAVPLYVIGSLVDLGLPSSDALARVQSRLNAHASDTDLESLPNSVAKAAGHAMRPADVGRELAKTKQAGNGSNADHGNASGGPPANVPANGGHGARPSTPPGAGHKPSTPHGP